MMRRRTFLLSSIALASATSFVYVSSRDARSWFYPTVALPVLHRIDAEQAHHLSIKAASYALFPKLKSSQVKHDDQDMLKVDVLGMEFRNPVGLAAGYDKNAECMHAMSDLGFGFMEVGSICPQPQPGNPKPRVFRLKTTDGEGTFDSIINRMGFPTEGMDIVEERLKRFREGAFDKSFPVGVNIGKNKISAVDSVEDYVVGLNRLSEYADFLVINVSSPNTPHLRSLQNRDPMAKLLAEIQKFRASNPKRVLIKVAPDLTEQQMQDVSELAVQYNIDGIIISNTTIDRPDPAKFTAETRNVLQETGGLSGRPVRDKSTHVLREIYKLTNGSIPLIGVGGVSTGRDALEKIEAGASLVQLYSSFTAKGPSVVDDVNSELVQLLKQKGYKNVREAIGSFHKKGPSQNQ